MPRVARVNVGPIPVGGFNLGISGGSNNQVFATGSNGESFWSTYVRTISADGSNYLMNPDVNFASGSNIVFTFDAPPLGGGSIPSNTVRIHSTGGGGSATISAGSNSTRVREISTAGASTTLWSPFDHAHDGIGTITSSSSNTMQRGTWNIRAGAGIALSLTDTDGDGEFDTTTISTTSAGGGGSGSSSDIIATMFGTPDTAYEFNTSSLTGLTAMGTPDAEDANTTVPGSYYLADNTSTTAWCGRYQAIPAYPFTAMICIKATNSRQNFNGVGVFVSVATPGKFSIVDLTNNERKVQHELFTNPTTFLSTVNGGGSTSIQWMTPPCYLALVAASTTSVTYYCSLDGIVWQRVSNAHDPSMTIGSVGFAAKSENSAGIAVAIDWFRIWNSSKTFLTGV